MFPLQLLSSLSMKKTSEVILRHRTNSQSSLNNNAQLQQALAQIEASISRKEIQKIAEKSKRV